MQTFLSTIQKWAPHRYESSEEWEGIVASSPPQPIVTNEAQTLTESSPLLSECGTPAQASSPSSWYSADSRLPSHSPTKSTGLLAVSVTERSSHDDGDISKFEGREVNQPVEGTFEWLREAVPQEMLQMVGCFPVEDRTIIPRTSR